MRYERTIDLIGNTPVVRLARLGAEDGGAIYLKLEKTNPGGSIKDRAVLGMLEEARRSGRLQPDSVLVEATSGNTGIALAMAGAILGHRVCIVMPDSMSRERQDTIRAYGAELVLTPGAQGMKGAIERADGLLDTLPGAVALEQFENPGNPRIHEETTVREILRDVPEVDTIVCGIGTGGTVTGIARGLQREKPAVRLVGVEPDESAVLSGAAPGAHKIQGIGAGFIPDVLEREHITAVRRVTSEQAMQMTRRLAREEGLFLGLSSGAALAAALEEAKARPGEIQVVIAPDGGDKYISTGVFGKEEDHA